MIQLAHNGRIFIRRFDDATGETGLASGNFTEISAVPEPNIVFLFSLGLASLVAYRKWQIA
ncbi:PEP-CTERM sorting domain-containing protein [Nitrosomonas sp.]|uniref:PEP-CTERM sorting domain-containing protein n=1 Tax=Nitrosomonas sp. TaxID=42353 RepID=UPI0025DB4CAF|nr:PEP-CTERM sorting domain-containing protein [Nitrosomonas sp.]